MPRQAQAWRLALLRFCENSSGMLPDEQPVPKQLEILRGMTGEQRLRLAERLYWSARRLKLAGLRAQHPDWPDKRLKAELRQLFLHART